MDILEEVAGVTPVNLDDVVETRPLEPLAPEASIRNRAAQTALLSDKPEKLVENYQVMMKEGMEGKDDTRSLIKNKVDGVSRNMSQTAILSILGDKSKSLQEKEAAIAALNSDAFKDTGYQLAMGAALEAAPNESVVQEDARISAAETFGEIYKYKKEKQALINSSAAELDGDMAKAFSGLLEQMIPFASNKQASTLLSKVNEELKIKDGKLDILHVGSNIDTILETLSLMPLDKKIQAERTIAGLIKNNSKIFFRDDNDFAKFGMQQALLGEEGYGKFDKIVDNVSGYLDIIGVGGTIRNVVKTLKGVNRSNAALRGIADVTSPVAPANLVAEVSPEKAKNLYKLVVQSQGDEAAQAAFGANRIDAVSAPVLPQPATSSGAIESKVINIDEKLYDEAVSSGGIQFTDVEKASIRAKVEAIARGDSNATVHDNMITVGHDGNKAYIEGVYGQADGYYTNAEDAVDKVAYALKDFGVTKDELTLLRREGDEFFPTELKDAAGKEGTYLVKYKGEYIYSASDVEAFDSFKVRLNVADRIPFIRSERQGTAANHMMTHSSMLDPTITGSAIVGVDKSAKVDKLFIKQLDDFAVPYSKLPKERQGALDEYFKEANFKGIELDDVSLKGRGFTDQEIGIVKKHREFWDTQYFFENRDLNRTLSNQGYKRLEHSQKDSFIAKPAPKNQNIGRVYDPDTNQIVNLTVEEMDDLYAQNGFYAKLRNSETINGFDVDHIIVRNNSNSYLRSITATDQTLEYRKGYYQVHYNAPKFIDRLIKDSSGRVTGKTTLAVAGDSREAEIAVRDAMKRDGLNRDSYNIRGDKNGMRTDSETYWDLQTSHGRIAQRHRGQRLRDVQAPPGGFDSKYVDNPIDSAVRSARSLSTRVSMRDVIETHKARAVQQYGKFFKTENGMVKWPSRSNDLIDEGNMGSKEIADARTTVEYINYLERGYVNGADEVAKGVANYAASLFAKAGMSGAERVALGAANVSPIAKVKEGTFHALIGTNFIRQALLQAVQGSRMAAVVPTYIVNPKGFFADLNVITAKYMNPGYRLNKAEQELFDYVEGSGILSAVDRSNLVRGAISDMVHAGSPVTKTVGKALAVPRMIGFDFGERSQLVAHMLAAKELIKKEGLSIATAEGKDRAHSLARALSGDMNFAGDMPYNQNWSSLLAMYLQVPHKMVSTVTTDRRIPTSIKLRMAGFDMLMYGVPMSFIASNLIGDEMLPDDPVKREVVLFGVISAGLNKFLSELAGKETNTDFTSMNPYQLDGWAAMAEGFFTGGIMEMLNNTPASNIYWKEGGKLREALGRTARYTGFVDPYEGHSKEDILSVMKGWMEITSLVSNFQKASMIMETGKLMDRNGNTFNSDATWVSAAMQMFGFGSQEQLMYYYAQNKMREGTKDENDEVKKWAKDYARVLVRQNKIDTQDEEFTIKMLGVAKLHYKNDPQKMQLVYEEVNKMNNDVKLRFYGDMLKYGGIKGSDENIASLRNLKILGDDQMNKIIEVYKDVSREKKQTLGEE